MEARTAYPARYRRAPGVMLPLALLALAALGVLSLLGLILAPETSTPTAALPAGERIAYFQFDSEADTLYTADPASPGDRTRLLVIPHAGDFGVVPAIAPDGRSFVYTALPAGLKAPSADTPASLWLYRLGDKTPSLLASNVDLLVRPVWSADGSRVVYRRSQASGAYQLFSYDLRSGSERQLVSSAGDSLLPVAFTPNSARLFYVSLAAGHSDLYSIDLAGGTPAPIARLSDGLSRDWTLSPDGRSLAFLDVKLDGGLMTASARLLDLPSGVISPIGSPQADAFGPTYAADGSLWLGQPGGLLRLAGDGSSSLQPPARGFDVPLAFSSRNGGIAVRSFQGASVASPGQSVLAFVAPDGSRRTIATGEVTFLGWINH